MIGDYFVSFFVLFAWCGGVVDSMLAFWVCMVYLCFCGVMSARGLCIEVSVGFCGLDWLCDVYVWFALCVAV